jgi:hypothetical protein
MCGNMKTKIIFFVLALCLIFNHEMFAESTVINQKNKKKTYITSGDIQIVNNELFLFADARLIPISKVGKDKKGVYVTLTDSAWAVKCSKCKQIYDLDNCSKKCPHPMNVYRPNS